MNTTEPDMLHDELRQAILDSGRSLYSIAKEAGVSRDAVGRFVSGERDFFFQTAAKIAEVLGMRWTTDAPQAEPPAKPATKKAAAKRNRKAK